MIDVIVIPSASLQAPITAWQSMFDLTRSEQSHIFLEKLSTTSCSVQYHHTPMIQTCLHLDELHVNRCHCKQDNHPWLTLLGGVTLQR